MISKAKSSKCLWASVVGAVLLGAAGILLYLFGGSSTISPLVPDEPEHDIMKKYSYNDHTLIFAQVVSGIFHMKIISFSRSCLNIFTDYSPWRTHLFGYEATNKRKY